MFKLVTYLSAVRAYLYLHTRNDPVPIVPTEFGDEQDFTPL